MQKYWFCTLLIFISIILFSCLPKAPLSSDIDRTNIPPITTEPEPVKTAWEMSWEKAISQAKKESLVRVYSTAPAETRQALMDAVKAKFGLNSGVHCR